MKTYRILKDFNGSQTGHDFHQFQAGTTADLSDDLARIAVDEGWAKPVGGAVESRETKVIAPAETKPASAGDAPQEPAPAEPKPAAPAAKKHGKK